MNNETRTSVRILGEEYQILCPLPQQESLIQAAQFLDNRMRSIQGKGAISGIAKIAVMAAINIAHELLTSDIKSKNLQDESQENCQILKQLTLKLENVLTEHNSLL